MKVLVTGGTGFVGSHLVRALLARGYEVTCLVRPTSRLDNLQHLSVDLQYGDVRCKESVQKAVKGCRIVYHCAADYRLWCPNASQMESVNVGGTRNVLQCSSDEGVERVVYTSTVGCLGLSADGSPAREETPAELGQMAGSYKRTKFLAEQEARQWAQKGLPVVVVNPSTPVGELDVKPTPTGKMIVDFLRGKMFGYVDSGMNLIDVRDVAEGHLQAAELGRVGERYILGNLNLTLKEIFDLLAKISGVPSPKIKIPSWVGFTYAILENFWSGRLLRREPSAPLDGVKMSRHKMWFDASKAVRELRLPQNSVEVALERAVHWFLKNGYVQR
jgi:dihydroflavonol-4-reductase